jgi:16S rRNA (uracil1498-N3)-methyltransferase
MSTRVYTGPQELVAGPRTVSGDEHHYLFRVLRLTVDDVITLFDGGGRVARASVTTIDAASAVLEVSEPTYYPPSKPRVVSYVPLLKGERMDLCIQKLVELGADRIVPVQSQRCVVRLDANRQKSRLKRWRQIALQAAAQCRTPYLPEVGELVSFEQAVDKDGADLRLLFYEGAAGESPQASLPASSPAQVSLLTGPEGGLTPTEVEMAESAGFLITGLGPRILRAETAAMTAVMAINFSYGR